MTSLHDRMHAAAKPYLSGWRYGRTPRVAWPWPAGVRGPAVARTDADREIDCSTLTASLLMKAYPEAGWAQGDYRDLQVMDPEEPDSPVAAVCAAGVDAAGVGVRADAFAPESWHLVQGWRRLPGDPAGASGHAIIVYSRGNGALDVLESSSRQMIGPRWRMATEAGLHLEFGAALYIARLVEPKAA